MTIEQQDQELQKLKLGALRTKYNEIVGAETKSNNRPYLIKRILQALQSRAPVVVEAVREAASVEDAATSPANAVSKRERDPRIRTYPPDGTSETLAYAIGAWLRGAARSSTGQRRDARPSTPLG